MKRFLLAILLVPLLGFSETIPESRRVPWIPGYTVGPQIAIPTRTNLINIATNGFTTNNALTTGTIELGTNELVVASAASWSIGHGVWFSNSIAPSLSQAKRVTNIIGNTLYLDTVSYYAGTTNVNVHHDNAPVINYNVSLAVSNDVLWMPNGVYPIRSGFQVDKSYVSFRGESWDVELVGLGPSDSIVFAVGHGGLSADPSTGISYMEAPAIGRTIRVASGATKGSTNLSLFSGTNGYGEAVKVGDAYMLSTLTRNTGSTNMPIIGVSGFDRIIKQLVIVHTKTGTNITITAPLVWDLTNNPILSEMDTQNQFRRQIGIENFTITLSNRLTGESGVFQELITAQCIRDSWVTNVQFAHPNNYALKMHYGANNHISQNLIRDPLTIGTSHAGMLLASLSGCLFEDNIMTSDWDRSKGADGVRFTGDDLALFPAIEVNDGVNSCAFFANLMINNNSDIHMHNSHPMMNLVEANVMGSFFQSDGYFGSVSHFTLFRNDFTNTVVLKKFNSNFNIQGNRMGNSNNAYILWGEQSAYGSPYYLIESGYPAIGHNSFVGSTADGIAWNFPGQTILPFTAPFDLITNGLFVVTNAPAYPTNVIWTNMGIGTLTNIPTPYVGGYALLFQDGINTNAYFGSTNPGSLLSLSAGTTSNLTLDAYVWLTNGMRLFIAGQQAYPHLQAHEKLTHDVHGNYLFTNGLGQLGVTSWGTNADRSLPDTWLYTTGAPPFWVASGLAFPAIVPETTNFGLIPAQVRLAQLNAEPPSTPIVSSFGCADNIVLGWSPVGAAADGYVIKRGTTSGMLTTITNVGNSVNAWTNLSVSDGVEYFYTITASNEFGFSDESAETSSETEELPDPPTGVAAVGGDAKVTLSWNAADRAVAYWVYRGTSSGSLNAHAIVTSLGYTNTGLANGTTYFYEILPASACGIGAASSEVSATPQAVVTGSTKAKRIHRSLRLRVGR